MGLFAVSQQYNFVPYSVEDGLAQTQVFDICSDDYGKVWFGTAGGASCFDGTHFKSFSKENGLTDNSVVSILNHDGFIWIATQSGITRIKNKELLSYSLSNLLDGESISSISVSNQKLWLAAKTTGVIELPLVDNVPILEQAVIHSIGDQAYVRSVFVDNEQTVWIGAKGFLGYYQDEKWIPLMIPDSDHNISDIDQSKDGGIWVSTYQEGVYHLRNDSITNYSAKDGLLSDYIRSVFVDSYNRIWLSSKDGVSVIVKDQIITYSERNGLENENIKIVTEGKEGNIWMGSDGSGAYKFSGDEFVNFDSRDGLVGDYVMSIVQDTSGNFWFSTYGEGISRYDGQSFTNYHSNNSALVNNTVWTSLLDKDGGLWFGTSGGLVHFEKENFKTYVNENWLPSNKITSLFQDRHKRIWVGTSKGVVIMDGDKYFTFNDTTGLPAKNIRAIEEVGNHLLLGTSEGVYVFEDGVFAPWRENKSIGNESVYCIEKWGDHFFVGTGNGLFYFDGVYTYQVKLHDAYSANYINFLSVEQDNILWAGTNYGIFEIDLNLFNPMKKNGITHFSSNDGLRSLETNLNAIYGDEAGHVWMGTGKGLLRFDRNRRKEQVLNIPEAELTDLQLFLQPTDWLEYADSVNPYTLLPEALSVKYQKNYFTFYYDAVSINRPEELRYRIKLDGFDEEWSPPIDQKSVTYGNLPYGFFTFNVIASIDGVNWGAPASFSFEIRKPYYLTWWFFILIGAILISLFYTIWQWNKGVQKSKQETERLVYKSRLLALEQQTLNASMNRHFIFNALNSIQYYINTQDKLSANKYLTSFARLIRKNLDSSSSGDSLVPLSEELERLELYISLEHMRFQNKFSYSIQIDEQIDKEEIMIPPMFLQPFVENSIWHGILPMDEGGKITVDIRKNNEGKVEFVIEDNGIGIDVSLARKSGHNHVSKGMSLTSGRINVLKKVTNQAILIDGPKQINNENGEPIGTRVIITLEGIK